MITVSSSFTLKENILYPRLFKNNLGLDQLILVGTDSVFLSKLKIISADPYNFSEDTWVTTQEF